MKRRLLSLALCLVTLLSLTPSVAHAEVLSGFTSKVDYDNTDPNRYSIEIDLVNQVITVYDQSGNAVLQSLCTTGSDKTPTGSGKFRLGDLKERFGYFVAYGEYAQYWTQVVRGVYIHSVMYNSKKLTSMSRGAYRKLGQAVSHGCVRVLPHVAQFIYYNCPPGTTCVINRKKAADPELVKRLKKEIPAYSDYKQPEDNRAEIPAVIKYDGTPLRTGFSRTKDTTVATLSRGDKVMLLQLAADWCKVRTADGKLGYVKTEYILAYPDNVNAVKTAYTAKSKTYVYKSMSTDSAKLATIPGGAQANVESNPKKGWWYGSYNGTYGYMRTRYVIKSETVEYPVLEDVTQPSTGANNSGASNGWSTGGGMFNNGSFPSATPTPTPAPAQSGANASIAAGIIANMRSGAGMDFPVIGSFSQGTDVTVIRLDGTWYYCQVNGQYGYIYSGCIVMK